MIKAAANPDSQESAEHHDEIFNEQVRLLYRHTSPLLFVNFLIGSALIYGFWSVASLTELLGWGGLIFGISLLRFALFLIYRRQATNDNAFFARLFVVTCVLSGIVWGSASIIFFEPGALQYQ